MIIIELEVSNQLNTALEKNKNIQQITPDILFNLSSSIDSSNEALKNYYNNYLYVATSFRDEMFKMEEELFKKWNLKDGLYMIYNEEGEYEYHSIFPIINENLVDKFYNAKSMSEVNNKEVLNNCKQEIIRQYDIEINEYARIYEIDEETVNNVKDDVPYLVDKYFDKVADKMLNNDVRDKLKYLCGRLEKAYKDGNFEKMSEITNQISQYLSKETTIYRDEELFKRLRMDLTRSKMMQNKIKEGNFERLSDVEEELITKFDNEQNELVQKTLDEFKQLSVDDVSFIGFSMETNLYREMFNYNK